MKIDQLPKKDFFKVPENYFEELPSEVFNSIKKIDKQMRFRRVLWFTSSSVAAIFILLIGIAFFFSNFQDETPLLSMLDTLEIKNNNPSLTQTMVEKEMNDTSETEFSAYREQKVKNLSMNLNNKQQSVNVVEANYDDATPDFCNLDYQIIEYYDDDLVRNEYYELK